MNGNGTLQPFDFRGAQVRTLIDEQGEPWFVAKDVCDILGLENSRKATKDLDSDEKDIVTISYGTDGNPNRTVVSESGLYSLVFRSRKPEAKAFRRWVTHEVLPQIRRTGGYVPVRDGDSEQDIEARAQEIAQRTIQQVRADMQRENNALSRRADRQRLRIRRLTEENRDLRERNDTLYSCVGSMAFLTLIQWLDGRDISYMSVDAVHDAYDRWRLDCGRRYHLKCIVDLQPKTFMNYLNELRYSISDDNIIGGRYDA